MEDVIKVQLCIRDFDFFDAFLNTANEMVNDERIDEAIRNKPYKNSWTNKIDIEAVQKHVANQMAISLKEYLQLQEVK